MKKRIWTTGALCLLAVVGLLFHPVYGARAQEAWQVLFNGKITTTSVVQSDSSDLVPIYFEVPRDGETDTYSLLIESDTVNRQVKVTRVKKKGPLIERGDCPKCSGSKKCQSCYPAGSGKNTAGYECYNCNANGNCAYCQGSGKCYQCGGGGYPNGCGTCGDVSK